MLLGVVGVLGQGLQSERRANLEVENFAGAQSDKIALKAVDDGRQDITHDHKRSRKLCC
jgi:hypothetical protein